MLPVEPSKVPPSQTVRQSGPSREMLETSEQINAFCNPRDLPEQPLGWKNYFENRSVTKQHGATPLKGLFAKARPGG